MQRYSTKILPRAKDSLDLVTTGLRQGEFNYLMVLTAQRTYFQTNLAYLTALRDLRESTIAIEGLLVAGEPREKCHRRHSTQWVQHLVCVDRRNS